MSRRTGTETQTRNIPLVAVIGATATGKTALGVELATHFDGEVVNADSRLFFRGMDIGTAKPSEPERRGIRHHLIDILEPKDGHGLSEFLRNANRSIADIHARGKLPIVVGGSGQYIWGLLEGWRVPEIPPNPELREELESTLENEGIGALQSRLKQSGAKNLEKVEILNPRRLIRAIERAIATGDAMGGAGKSDTPPFDSLIIGLTAAREILHKRVDLRVSHMLEAGWIDEVKALIETGVKREMPSMSAIGYRDIIDYLNGAQSWDATHEAILIGNNRLIGAQHNWFKPRDPRINWVNITEKDHLQTATQLVENWLPSVAVNNPLPDVQGVLCNPSP